MNWLCRLIGHKWRLPPGFYTIGQSVTYHCVRKDCDCGLETTFNIERH